MAEEKEKDVVEDNNKESNDEKVDSKPEEKSDAKENTVDAKPEETTNGALADLAKQLKSMKQEIIDYVDLKFASAPIAKVENPKEDEKPKELDVW